MRILHLNYVPSALPMLVRSFEIARAVSALGHDVTLAYMSRRFAPAGAFADVLEGARSPRLRILHAPVPSHAPRPGGAPAPARRDRATLVGLVRQMAGSLRYLPAEDRLVAAERPDVIVARPDHVLSFPITARRRGVPLVLETDGAVEELDHYWGIPSRWVRPIDTSRARLARALLVVSDVCAELWRRKGLAPELLFLCPNGADPEVFRPSPQRREDVRRRLGLEGAAVVGFSGNQRVWHGAEAQAKNMFDRLLAAILPILRDRPAVKLLVIGTLQERAALGLDGLPTYARERVVLSGAVPYPEMPGLIDAADVMAMPYPELPLFHFSPMKMFEALSMAKPIVASRQGQVATVLDGLESAYLYDPRDGGALEAALRRALDDVGAGRTGAAGRRLLCERHTWAHRGRVVADACTLALDGARRGGAG